MTVEKSTVEAESTPPKLTSKFRKKPLPVAVISLFDGPKQPLLDGLRAAPQVFGLRRDDDLEQSDYQPSTSIAENDSPPPSVSSSTGCSVCKIKFEDSVSQREHYKLDWHRFNLKLNLEGKECGVTEDKFDSIVEEVDNISLSGSEDGGEEEEEEDAGIALKERHPKLFFANAKNELFSVYKCALSRTKNEKEDADLIEMIPRVAHQSWAVFMLGGGHFAGAIFDGKTVLVHKTFHCYTVRAKQGGSQSAKDNKSGGSHPKSAGASLRRYNEAALIQHVQDIVKLWSKELEKCEAIFYRAASGNRAVLFGGKEPPLSKTDPRLFSIPFPTRRATFNEVKRVHETLGTVEALGDCDLYLEEKQKNERRPKAKPSPQKSHIHRSKSREVRERPLPDLIASLAEEASTDDSQGPWSNQDLVEFENSPVKLRKAKKKKHKKMKETEMPEESNELSSILITACKSGNLKLVEESVASMEDEEKLNDFLNQQFGNTRVTPLHLAAAAGKRNIIKFLLENGADPSLKDKSKKVPYNVCIDKESRNVFRQFRGQYPDRYDYTACQIPPPTTEEEEQRQKEKKAKQRAAKREKEKAKREAEKQVKAEEEEKQRYLNLSDREKRALAAERRLLAQKSELGESKPILLRCFHCGNDMTGKVPFEYEAYKFCVLKCLQQHRKKGTK